MSTLLGRIALPVITLVLVAPSFLALVAIGWFDWRPGVSAENPATPLPGQANDIAILAPDEGRAIKGSTVTLKFTVDGALAPQEAVPDLSREGLVHLHVILGDGQYDDPGHSSAELFEAEPGSEGHYSIVAGDARKITYKDLAPGTYTIRTELLANDHNPSEPVATDDVTVTVK